MTETPAVDLRLVLGNRPENVAVVRQALAGVAEAIGLDHAVLEEIKTAVSEACNNVVLHAYAGGSGPLEVTVGHDKSRLEVRVCDRGIGFSAAELTRDPEAALPGMGIELMRALGDRVSFTDRPGGGTEVSLGFDSPVPLPLTTGAVSAPVEPVSGEPDPPARVWVGAGRIAAPVLGRITGMLAARAGLSVERLADAQLITDALAAHAPGVLAGEALDFTVLPDGVGVYLGLGPLRPGGGEELLRGSSVAGVAVIERLADRVDVERDTADERLRVLVGQR